MPKAHTIQYNSALSVKENAKQNGVSDATIRNYIKTNGIDRRYERKQNVIDECRKCLKRHPKATRNEIQQKTGHSLSTIRKYWKYITAEEALTNFDNKKVKKRQAAQERQKQERIAYLDTIPLDFLKEYVKNRESNQPQDITAEKPKVKEVTILGNIPFNPYNEYRIPVNDCIQFHSKALPENRVLSNHYDCIITFRGVEFYSLEQLFMGLTYSDSPDVLKRVMAAKSGLAAKKICREKYPDKRDWDFEEKRYRIIALCHLYKYLSVKEYRDRLRETYSQTLVECPNGQDYHFGMVQNLKTNVFEGNNCSGRTTMLVRDLMKIEEDNAVRIEKERLGRDITDDEREAVYEALYLRVRAKFDNDKQVLKDSKPLFSFIEKEGIPKVKVRRPKPLKVPEIDRATKCLVVDFDFTVFDTSADDAYRKSKGEKDWKKIFELIPQYKLYDGWRDVFEWTNKNGVKVAVLSGAKRELVEKAFQYFNLPCETVIGYQPYIEKPNPILGNMLMEKLNIRESQIILVGDSEDDDVQARCSKFGFVGATWHFDSDKDYFKERGVQTVNNPKELISIMEEAGWKNPVQVLKVEDEDEAIQLLGSTDNYIKNLVSVKPDGVEVRVDERLIKKQ